MEREYPATDYAAILADMEAKKAALENAIAGLRAALASGALGVVAGDSLLLKDSMGVSLSPVVAAPGTGSIALPRGAFLGKTATEAIRLYLSAIRKKQTNKEIAQALKDGGMESTRKNFDNLVTNGLFRLKRDGVVLRFEDGWGLAEWYPESFRNRAVQEKPKNGKKSIKPKAKKRATKPQPKESAMPQPGTNAESEARPGTRIESLLRESAPNELQSSVIAQHVGISNLRVVEMLLGKLISIGHAEKTASGGYRSPKLREITKAG